MCMFTTPLRQDAVGERDQYKPFSPLFQAYTGGCLTILIVFLLQHFYTGCSTKTISQGVRLTFLGKLTFIKIPLFLPQLLVNIVKWFNITKKYHLSLCDHYGIHFIFLTSHFLYLMNLILLYLKIDNQVIPIELISMKLYVV